MVMPVTAVLMMLVLTTLVFMFLMAIVLIVTVAFMLSFVCVVPRSVDIPIPTVGDKINRPTASVIFPTVFFPVPFVARRNM